MALNFDAMGSSDGLTGGSGTINVSCTVISASSHAFILGIACTGASGDVATGVTGVTGVTWTKLSTGAGNGACRTEFWFGLGLSSTGAQTATVALNTLTIGAAAAFLYSYTGAHQTTPANGFVATTSADNVITVASGDAAVSYSIDDNNNRTLLSGSCNLTADVSTFGNVGRASTHCTDTPTSTFKWSGFGAASGVAGCSVLQAGGGADVILINRNIVRVPMMRRTQVITI
jgi:hypothetical protein